MTCPIVMCVMFLHIVVAVPLTNDNINIDFAKHADIRMASPSYIRSLEEPSGDLSLDHTIFNVPVPTNLNSNNYRDNPQSSPPKEAAVSDIHYPSHKNNLHNQGIINELKLPASQKNQENNFETKHIQNPYKNINTNIWQSPQLQKVINSQIEKNVNTQSEHIIQTPLNSPQSWRELYEGSSTLQKLLSNRDLVRNILAPRQQKEQFTFTLVYPNGTIGHEDNLETIRNKHPDHIIISPSDIQEMSNINSENRLSTNNLHQQNSQDIISKQESSDVNSEKRLSINKLSHQNSQDIVSKPESSDVNSEKRLSINKLPHQNSQDIVSKQEMSDVNSEKRLSINKLSHQNSQDTVSKQESSDVNSEKRLSINKWPHQNSQDIVSEQGLFNVNSENRLYTNKLPQHDLQDIISSYMLGNSYKIHNYPSSSAPAESNLQTKSLKSENSQHFIVTSSPPTAINNENNSKSVDSEITRNSDIVESKPIVPDDINKEVENELPGQEPITKNQETNQYNQFNNTKSLNSFKPINWEVSPIELSKYTDLNTNTGKEETTNNQTTSVVNDTAGNNTNSLNEAGSSVTKIENNTNNVNSIETKQESSTEQPKFTNFKNDTSKSDLILDNVNRYVTETKNTTPITNDANNLSVTEFGDSTTGLPENINTNNPLPNDIQHTTATTNDTSQTIFNDTYNNVTVSPEADDKFKVNNNETEDTITDKEFSNIDSFEDSFGENETRNDDDDGSWLECDDCEDDNIQHTTATTNDTSQTILNHTFNNVTVSPEADDKFKVNNNETEDTITDKEFSNVDSFEDSFGDNETRNDDDDRSWLECDDCEDDKINSEGDRSATHELNGNKSALWLKANKENIGELLFGDGDENRNIFFTFYTPPEIESEKETKTTIYPNGTVVEEYSETRKNGGTILKITTSKTYNLGEDSINNSNSTKCNIE